jgi:glycosyltransferase involved in cell wall biosynthesis
MELSIVIPCYERHDLLEACLGSIDRRGEDVQVVLVDDGSEPSLEAVFSRHSISVDLFLRQQNRGRAAALREGLLRAEGNYVLIMDSDDEFIHGAIEKILADIKSDLALEKVGFVYECTEFDSGEVIARLPDSGERTLLGLRADDGVRGDLKEVVLRQTVLAMIYPDPGCERRVPTSYIWAGVSGYGKVQARSFPVVRHRYLPGGMTKNINALKKQNPKWLLKTYVRIACAPKSSYRSSRYRFLNAVKAMAVVGSCPDAGDLKAMRDSLGVLPYLAASICAHALRAGSRK